MDTPTAKNY